MFYNFKSGRPAVHPSAYVHESAVLIGRVTLSKNASVWPLAVLRGDVSGIEVGEATNIQDLAVLHGRAGRPVILGKGVTVGHAAVLHGCRVGDNCLIGMKAVVMESVIGRNSIIAAGALLSPGTVVAPGSLVMGIPGRVARRLSAKEIRGIRGSGRDYLKLLEFYRQ